MRRRHPAPGPFAFRIAPRPPAVRGSFSALLGDEDDLDGHDALNQRVAAAGDHGVVVDSVTVSVLL